MVWEACHGERHIGALSGTLFRLVESQEQVATRGFVDTLEEQAVLEELLETSKPAYREAMEGLDYLLKTPFRYPPLKWGSRFGQVHEPSLFYGGGSSAIVLAEVAYYRFLFWYSMEAKPVKEKLCSQHSLFSVGYETDRGVHLQKLPFKEYQADLTDPASYHTTQKLGSAMREAGVEGFEYCSARAPEGGNCVGLFTPAAFSQKRPENLRQCLCEVRASEVSFKLIGEAGLIVFKLEVFQVEGQLPSPA